MSVWLWEEWSVLESVLALVSVKAVVVEMVVVVVVAVVVVA